MRAPILHVAPFLWSGAGSVITRLCEDQRARGPVVLVTTGRSAELQDWRAYRQRLKRAGVVHHAMDVFHRDAETFWSNARKLADLLRDVSPGVVHAHAGVPSAAVVVARDLAGLGTRVIGQMYSWTPGRPDWMNRQDAWGLSRTDRVVCSARAYWDQLVALGVPARRLVYLPWGLPLGDLPWQAPRDWWAVGARPPIIGFVGRVEPRKGQLELVDAFARVRDAHAGARLELVGPVADERYAADIGRRIKRRGLQDAVTLTGQVRDVRRHVRRWDLFVSLSADEGQGLAVLEAMALGVVVVARPVAGIADFLDDGRTGIGVGSSAARVVSAAIVRALAEPARVTAISRRARRLVEQRYAWDRTVTAFDRLYGW
jgi:glycosyltransferase involved in cell wall biosynthesis